MIGNFIPEIDDHYRNHLLMLEITDYLMAPEISEDDVEAFNNGPSYSIPQ